MRRPAFATFRSMSARPILCVATIFALTLTVTATTPRDRDISAREDEQEPAPAVERQGERAQTPPPAQTPSPGPQPPPPAERQEPTPRPAPQHVNVKVDVTITDQSGSTAPVTKTLSVIVADRENGSIRSFAVVPMLRRIVAAGPSGTVAPNVVWDNQELPLNVDVKPEFIDNNRVKVRFVLNYRTAAEPKGTDGEPIRKSEVTENVVLILENGKPMVVSQSADAASDRKVTVELKATILR
jgi:hypothetical protein